MRNKLFMLVHKMLYNDNERPFCIRKLTSIFKLFQIQSTSDAIDWSDVNRI